ncbi:MAG: hypothetical protein AB8H80_09030 [Planctomycetota bacterium]
MSTALKRGTDKQLRSLLATAVATIGETLSSLVGRDIKVHRGDLLLQDDQAILDAISSKFAVARGAMDKDYEGKSCLTAFEMPDAITMAGLLMMTPDDVIAQRRKSGNLEGEDIEAFGELGNVLYSGFSNALRERLENFDLRMQDQGTLGPAGDIDNLLDGESFVTLSFTMKVGEFPESNGMLCIDADTAEKWNGGPLEGVDDVSDAAPAATTQAVRFDDAVLETIPAAPIRGVLSAFIVQSDSYRILRRSCRRVGLDLRRHGRGEIPNPSAHRNQIVVIDIPPGEDRRFDWCLRIKELSKSTKVVLLIRHPSRQRVTQAFLANADAILGFPCEEPQLSQKLEPMVPDAPSPEEPEDTPDGTDTPEERADT